MSEEINGVNAEEIEYYHDMLEGIIRGEEFDSAELFGETALRDMRLYRDVLCWLLGHENTAFIDNMDVIIGQLDAADIHFLPDEDDEGPVA